MTRLDALRGLLAKVKADNCDFDWGFAASPSRKSLPTEWHNAMNAYLGSLDAAKALHDAVLPGWAWTASEVGADVIRDEDSGDPFVAPYSGDCDLPARAWLIAILKALISEEPNV